MLKTIIRPQTAAESTGVELKTFSAISVVLVASGLASNEEVDIEIWNGVAYVPYRNTSGSAVTLTATSYMQVLPGGVLYRIKKDATAAAGGVVAYLNNQFVNRS